MSTSQVDGGDTRGEGEEKRRGQRKIKKVEVEDRGRVEGGRGRKGRGRNKREKRERE